ncbi:DNA-directed DNA polymerase [Caerostris extrusa]|uniref:DNA-directed DNA polymerase n=1 Tax=Caerostris extrusa TaxID=172846 RepID=A0AAV4SM42_CAEEX|nr:DNA-directed DNA polymerase [Caerostris extrusa]
MLLFCMDTFLLQKRHSKIRDCGGAVPPSIGERRRGWAGREASDNWINQEEALNRIVSRVDPERLPSGIAGVPLGTIVGALRQLFLTIIERSTETLAPTDLIRFYIQDDHLDHPISTTIMPVSDLTIEKILTEILKVLQSKKSIQLDSGFKVEIAKKSIVSIPIDDDNLCCAKAIVFALAHAKKDATAISAMKNRNRPALKKRAQELHEAAGVPLGPCTFQEVTYKGKERPLRINLWHHDNHYDVIKSVKGFFGSNYYCENCEKPYSSCESHRCPKACYICLRMSCPPDNHKDARIATDFVYLKVVIRHTKPSREKKKKIPL